MSSVDTPEFGRLRSMIWPVHRRELKRFLPMFIIYALIVFNYTLLKSPKDALVITAPGSGAEALPFIKIWAILPMALFFTFLFTRLSNRFSRERVFYYMMGIFIGFFFLFSIVIYPFRDVLHPHALADQLQAILPKGFKGLIAIFRNWTFSLFYVMAELWGTTIMTVLFWGFANEISTVKDAKRFYVILGVGANLMTILAGEVATMVSTKITLYPDFWFISDTWGYSLFIITSLVVVSSLIVMALYRYLNNTLVMEQASGKPGTKLPPKKIKMGIRENFAYLAKSKYLIRIAIIVLTFNISLNMVEIIWKDQIRLLFPTPADFNAYMGRVYSAIGVASTIVSIFFCGPIIRRFGWTLSAMITPMALLITGILFFSFLLFKDSHSLSLLTALLGVSPIALGVFFGSMQNCFSRACKFTFFDATKEMAFIPLSDECKLKGKAAIDGVGSRLGKSGGSIIHQFLLLIFGSVSLSTPFVAVILFGVVIAWIFAVKSLGRKFHAITTSAEKINIDDDQLPPSEQPTFVTPQEQKAY
ncbi:MAG: NTP/NDP exchange transporter [Chlamydiales bacterium]|nr:NTP/NDP exchange transporter [Chlamydiales bacterium]